MSAAVKLRFWAAVSFAAFILTVDFLSVVAQKGFAFFEMSA